MGTATPRSIAGPNASTPGATAGRPATRGWPERPGPKRARRDVFCYFDNDVKVHAPYDAASLAARLGMPTGLGPGHRFVSPPGLAPPRRRAPPVRTAQRKGRTAPPRA